jgi:hypothetical protein
MRDNLRIPYGVINWAKLVRECHFIDNTAYVRALEPSKPPVAATVVEVCGSEGCNWFDLPE